MPKEEIRVGILNCLRIQVGAIPNDKVDNCYEIEPYWKGRLASNIIEYLHSQGVVIEVDRELPEIPEELQEPAGKDSKRVYGHYWAGYENGKNAMLKAGYVAVEPLI